MVKLALFNIAQSSYVAAYPDDKDGYPALFSPYSFRLRLRHVVRHAVSENDSYVRHFRSHDTRDEDVGTEEVNGGVSVGASSLVHDAGNSLQHLSLIVDLPQTNLFFDLCTVNNKYHDDILHSVISPKHIFCAQRLLDDFQYHYNYKITIRSISLVHFGRYFKKKDAINFQLLNIYL